MELKHYLTILWRRRWTIAITAIVTTIVIAIGSYLMTPMYASEAILWVPTSDTTRTASTGSIQLADRLINTYEELATNGAVLSEVAQRLGVPVQDLLKLFVISVKPEKRTELLVITAQDPNPEHAAEIATTLANVLIKQTQRTDAGRTLRVSLFAPASVPEDPTWWGLLSTPFWREINIAIGFMLGLAAGVSLAFLFEYLDTTLYTTEQIETATELATLGQIPLARKQQQIASLNGNSLHGEAFRYLRTSILFEQATPLQTLLVTSALPGEGKSTIVANLALAIAQSGKQVIVVDADLRLPVLHKIFNLPAEVGLSSFLEQDVSLAEILQDSHIPGVQVVTSGPLPTNPAELLDSPQVVALIEQLKQYPAYVLIDTPSLLAVTDAAVLAPHVDGVALVVGRAQAHQGAVQAARYQLATVNANLVGLVVNRVVQDLDYYRRYTSKVA